MQGMGLHDIGLNRVLTAQQRLPWANVNGVGMDGGQARHGNAWHVMEGDCTLQACLVWACITRAFVTLKHLTLLVHDCLNSLWKVC
jgi:hypothetical protein